MQVMWMGLVTLGLALGGILRLALVTHVTALAGHRWVLTGLVPCRSAARGGAARPWALEPGASEAEPHCLP